MKAIKATKNHIVIQFTRRELDEITYGLFEYCEQMELNDIPPPIKTVLTNLHKILAEGD